MVYDTIDFKSMILFIMRYQPLLHRSRSGVIDLSDNYLVGPHSIDCSQQKMNMTCDKSCRYVQYKEIILFQLFLFFQYQLFSELIAKKIIRYQFINKIRANNLNFFFFVIKLEQRKKSNVKNKEFVQIQNKKVQKKESCIRIIF